MTQLPTRELGRTGLQITMLGYGAMELRGAPRGRDVSETQAETILHAALDAGINYIDTSIDYGVSEERIGRYIADRRAEYYLASKCGCLVGATPAPRGQRNPHVFTRDNILAGVEQSLARMHTDYLDVVQFQARRPGRPWRNTGRWRRCWNSSKLAPSGLSACQAPCPTWRSILPWACSMCSDSLLGGRARARGAHRSGGGGRGRYRHSRWGGQGRANRREASWDAMGPLAAGPPR